MGTAASSANLGHGFPAPGPQSPTGQRVMDHVFFLSRSEWKEARETGTYDLVIVGSGFCAYAVAKRALENNPFTRILIVERGPFFLPEHFQNLPTPFVGTLGGLSETFPWTLSARTAAGQDGTVRWQHGMVPFFGGRSTLWSAWCPTPQDREWDGWPEETVAAALAQAPAALQLLHVQEADKVDPPHMMDRIGAFRPVYGELQHLVQRSLLQAPARVPGVYRTEAAPLASDARNDDGIDFQKFAIPGELLTLVKESRARANEGKGAPLHIVTDCVVQRILSQDTLATALETSRGVLSLGNAKLVLAMGTLPPTTLVRNSFPAIPNLGERFSAHFITSIVARVPRRHLDPGGRLGELELAACYVAGVDNNDYKRQYHIQLSALSDRDPAKNAGKALRYMPDVVATASEAQLKSSTDHVVFVCAVLGELDYRNAGSWFRHNAGDADPTTNSLLAVASNSEADLATWEAMDNATFGVLERVLSPYGADAVQYWHGAPNSGEWLPTRPAVDKRRVDALVHESSTMHIGADEDAPVGLDYRVRGTDNVYLTGGALWPQGGSWNPTMVMVALSLDLADRLVPRGGPPHEAPPSTCPETPAP